MCLFITHYQSLAGVARGFEGGELKNVHMKFTATKKTSSGCISDVDTDDSIVESHEDKGDEEITFLYEVGEGVAHRSYGLNVARLANIPKIVLDTAATKSHELEMEVTQKKLNSLGKIMRNVLSEKNEAEQLEQLIVGIEEL